MAIGHLLEHLLIPGMSAVFLVALSAFWYWFDELPMLIMVLVW